MSNNSDSTSESQILAEILAWTRAMALPGVKQTIEGALLTAEQRKVYELSDGDTTTREIAAQAGIGSAMTVSRWWKRWRALGICVEAPGGKTRHLVTLEDIGIPLDPSRS